MSNKMMNVVQPRKLFFALFSHRKHILVSSTIEQMWIIEKYIFDDSD